MVSIWRNRIVDIYIIKEVLIPFLVGVAIVGIIMLSGILFQLTDLIIVKDIPTILVLRLLFYYLPEIIVQTFPVAILFATMYGMSRLARENEFTALRMGGVSLYRLISPLIILGIVISIMTFIINEDIVPWSNHEAQNIIRRSILKQAMPDIKESVFFKGPEGRIFYVKKYDEKSNTLDSIVVINQKKDEKYPQVITARSGKVINNIWQLEGGIIHRFTGQGKLYQGIEFDLMEYEIAKDVERFFGEQRTTSEMSRESLKKDVELFQKSGINVDSLLVDYHLKLSMPLAALIFILIGTPLSLSSKDSRAASIIFTIIVVFSYYLILSISQSFGKNSRIPPLLAAWLPNITFGLLGIILLIWRERWYNLLKRLLPFLTMFIIIFLLFEQAVQAEEVLKVDHADHLSFFEEGSSIELNGNVKGLYSPFHIRTDRAIIKLPDGSEKILVEPEEIVLDGGNITGCDLDEPHYFFQAKEVVIYPGDHLIAKHVVFYELNGKLPLFYWPYLYISLKDDQQKLVPKVGYNQQRGWFIKTTYYYLYKDLLPGELYADYYTISRWAGGFKQYLKYKPDYKSYIYLYGQQNPTDIPGLFQWEGSINIDDDAGAWKIDTDLDYTHYKEYSLLDGNISLRNYFKNNYFSLKSDFDSKDYYLTDNNDDKDLSTNLIYRRDLVNNWDLYFNYNRDYKYNPEDGLKERWGTKSYLQKKYNDLSFKVLMERYAPRFTDDDDEEEKVSFYRWPEFIVAYRPKGHLDYNLELGSYYEDVSGIRGYRGLGRVNYNNRIQLSGNTSLRIKESLAGRLYQVLENKKTYTTTTESELPYLNTFENKLYFTTKLTKNLTWYNNYLFQTYNGESPFNFDNGRIKEKIDSKLYYRTGKLNFTLSSGYDIYNETISPVNTIMGWQVTPYWKLNMGTSYNVEEATFGNLAVTSKYKKDSLQLDSALTYDLENTLLHKVDNKLIYDVKNNWYLELNSSYDNEDAEFDRANISLKKVFHCRALLFTYDHINQEYTLEYRLNLFPDKGIKMGGGEDEPFMFDFGIKDLLDMD